MFKTPALVVLHRSSGDTLSRENFYKLKSRIAEARMLASGIHAASAAGNEDLGCEEPPDPAEENKGALEDHKTEEAKVRLGSVPSIASSGASAQGGGIKKQPHLAVGISPLVMALRARAADIRNGHMARLECWYFKQK